MSKLADDLIGLQYVKTDLRKYKMDTILDQLEEDDQNALIEVMNNKAVTGVAIKNLLNENGYYISERAVQRYRKEVLWA